MYYLGLGRIPILVQNKPANVNSSWVSSDIITNGSGIFLYEQSVENWTQYNYMRGYTLHKNRIVYVTEINKDWAPINY